MFTGIVEELGTVTSFADGARLRIEATEVLDDVEMGDSIAVNGCCLTVVAFGDGWWEADVIDETLTHEQPRRPRARPSGEPRAPGAGRGPSRRPPRPGSRRRRRRIVTPAPDLHVRCEPDLTRYVVEKGSITVDGVSLTVVDALDDGFTVAIIPHTAEVTTLGHKGAGDPVNLEVDVIAKYAERLLVGQTGLDPGAAS